MKYLPFLFLLLFWRCDSAEENKQGPRKVRVAVAANAYYPLREIASKFKQLRGVQVEIISGSSGKLCNQILQGAPFDLFLSADEEYPQKLYESGKYKETPQAYAFGKLILWTKDRESSLELNTEKGMIALPNPELAPYGRGALEYLRSLDLEGQIEQQLVYAESVAQASVYVSKGLCAIGFTSNSALHNPQLDFIPKFKILPDSTYTALRQDMILLKDAELQRSFFEFLLAEDSREVFSKYDYDLP